MNVMEYVAALRRQWIAIIVLSALGAVAGLALGKLTPPTYQATSQVFVSVTSGETIQELAQGTTFTQNIVQSYVQLARTPAVLNPVISSLSLDTSAKHLAKRVHVESPINTVFIDITVDAVDPEEAADIANAIADQLPETVESLTPTAKETPSGITLTTVTEATEPNFPISPNTKLYIAIGFVLGALLGIAFAIIRQLLDTRVGDRDDLAATTKLPVLGVTPLWGAKNETNKALPMLKQPEGVAAESYRRLRSNLDFVWSGTPGAKSVMLTSARPGDGKTTTSLNLALALAERGDRVVLVDADLRRPSIAKATGLEQAVGLTTVLIEKVPLRQALQSWTVSNLDVLTSGEIPPNALQLIDSPKTRNLISRLKDLYDYVVIDAPPLLSVVDASLLAREVDGTIVVVSSGHTKRAQVTSVLEALEQAGEKPVGTVLTRARAKETGYSYDYSSDESE
ncbi:MAG: polysaccharide biosynthesis tyrosine autokinase [Aeromicrobium sp.]|nr:MAG: polysaccharide biosynthesis tyrosine autokinase [Aeromicrobium sp.]